MKKNKKILLASVLATGFVFGGAMALNANVASAASNFDGIDFTNVVMSEGAAVRVSADVNDTNYGIRFQMNMDQTTYNTLETRGASYGIAIFPADYNYAISESAIFAADTKATLVESETLSDSNKDGTYDMWGSLVNIKPANVTREFVGIGYVELNGEYKLANAYGGDIANNTRSIYYVAQLAVDKNDKHADVAKETYIDTFDTAGKQYAYTVEHVYKKDGEVVKKETTTEYGTLNTNVSATAKTNVFYKAENATAQSTLYANGNTKLTLVYNDNTTATTYKADYVKVSGDNVTLDLTKFADMPMSAEKVFVDGTEVSATSTGTQITVPVVAGEREIAVYDGENCYVADVIVADYEITNQATLKTWGQAASKLTYKYAVVTRDIVCDGSDLQGWDNKPTYKINGLGHTITGARYAYGYHANAQTQVGYEMKNITFENMIIDNPGTYTLLGHWVAGGLYENVNMSVTYKIFPKDGLLFNELDAGKGNMTFRNCNFSLTVPEADTDKIARLYNDVNGFYGSTMENVTIMANCKIAGVGELSTGHDKPGVVHGHPSRGEQSVWTNVNIYDKDDMEVLTSSEKGVLMTDGKITLNTTKFAKQVNVDEVIVGAFSVDYTLSGNTLTVPVSGYGETQIRLVDATANKIYTLTVTVADYLISDQASFKNWGLRIKEGYKYLILTKDIVCDGSDLTAWNGVYDNAVLDGMGYTVSNANYSYGIFTAVQPNSATIKNITFENMKLSGESHFYSFGGAWTKGVVFENVNLSATYDVSKDIKGLIFSDMGNNNPIILRNCNFNFTVPEAQANNEIKLYDDSNGAYKTTMENVTIMANCKIANVKHSTDSWKNVTILDKDDMTALTTSEKYVKLTDGKATLDLTKLSATVAVSNVMVNGLATEYTLADNKLTFAASAGLNNVMLVDATANKLYTIANVKVADVVMTNFAELKAFWENATVFTNSKYAVIANDITCEATEIVAPAGAKNVGVIDGLGNTVTNMTMNRGIFFNAANVTLRDITFANFTSTNHIVKSGTNLFATGLIAYYAKNLDVINVNMTTTLSADNWLNCTNLLGYCDANGSYGYSFVGCNFQINCREDMKATAMSVTGEMWYYKGSFTNTTITYTGTLNLEKDFAQAGAKITYSNAKFTDMTGTYTK